MSLGVRSRRRVARIAVAAAMAAAMGTSGGAFAVGSTAADDGNVSGGDISGPGDETSRSMQAQNDGVTW